MGTLGRLLLAGVLGAFGGGCFVGDAAEGLPCEQDADCGLGVSCAEDPAAELKCCGGSCLLSGSSGPGGPSSSSSSTGPTSLSATESSSGPSVCTDGVVDPGEACEPESGSSLCGDDCQFLCGNGELDAGEECDDDEPSCGEDCQFSMRCGNEMLDPGEACDVRLAETGTCLEDCTRWVALDWNKGAAGSDFCADETGSDVPGACSRWTDVTIGGPIGSGPYFRERDTWSGPAGSWPEAILRTRPINFPDVGPGDSVQIEFVHELNFNSNPDPDEPEFVDYAELSIESSADDGALRFVPLGVVAPLSVDISCSGQSSDATCTTLTPQDYCEPGLVRTAGRTSGEETVFASYTPSDEPLDGLARLRFLVRYDCSNFQDPKNPITPNAWVLHSLKVTVIKAGAGG